MSDAIKQAGGDQLSAPSQQIAREFLKNKIDQETVSSLGGHFKGNGPEFAGEVIKHFGGTPGPELANQISATKAMAAGTSFESRNLSRKQVQAIFERVVKLNNRMLSEGRLEEGIWDDIKSGAGKGLQGVKNLAGKAAGAVAQKAQTVGHNLTTKTTADKLTKAWKAAGSPTDSEAISTVLQSAGVAPDVIAGGFKAAGVKPAVPKKSAAPKPSAQGQAAPGTKGQYAPEQLPGDITSVIGKLTVPQLQQLIAQLDASDKAQAASPATAKPTAV
jgi:hypothetical protein